MYHNSNRIISSKAIHSPTSNNIRAVTYHTDKISWYYSSERIGYKLNNFLNNTVDMVREKSGENPFFFKVREKSGKYGPLHPHCFVNKAVSVNIAGNILSLVFGISKLRRWVRPLFYAKSFNYVRGYNYQIFLQACQFLMQLVAVLQINKLLPVSLSVTIIPFALYLVYFAPFYLNQLVMQLGCLWWEHMLQCT